MSCAGGKAEIMEIDRLGPVIRPQRQSAAGASDRGLPTPAAAAPPPPPPPSSPPVSPGLAQAPTTVAMLMAMASADPQRDRRARMASDSARGVHLLDKLHRAVVAGEADAASLQALAEWLEGFEVPDDPHLAALARDIALRVEVELAKHEAGR